MFHKEAPVGCRKRCELLRRRSISRKYRRCFADLSEYKLGIFMPHMHDEQTGEFRQLPDDVMQVESGLAVSFRATAEIANQIDHFLPVGWYWRAGEATSVAACEMVREEGRGETERSVKHKMPSGI